MAQAGTIANAYVQVLPSTKGIGANLSRAMTGAGRTAGVAGAKSFGGSFKGMLVKLGIGAAVIKILKDTISEGAALQQSYIGGLDTIYTEAADTMRDYADAAASYGISANSYAEQAVSMGAALRSAFGGDTQKAAESANMAIQDMADNAAKMGSDVGTLQSAYQGFAKQNYTMLDNLKLGYGGTKTEMERLLADAEKITGVHYDISNLGDVYSAIHVIQGELGLTGVAADEAKTTVSGSFNSMKASAKDLIGHIALGDDIQPQLEAFGSSVKNFFVGNFFPMIGSVFASLVKMIPNLLSSLASSISDFAQSMTDEGAGEALSSIGSWISNTFVPYMQDQFLPALAALGSAIWDAIEAFIGNVVPTLLSKLSDAIDTLSENISNVSGKDVATVLGNVANKIGTWITQTFIPFLLQKLLPALGKLGLSLLKLIGQLLAFLWQTIWAAITEKFPWIQTVVDTIKNVFITVFNVIKTIIGAIVAVISTGINIIKTIISAAITAITGIIQGIQAVVGFISGVFDSVATVISNVWNGIASTISNVIDGISSTISSVFDGIKTTVTTIWDGIKTAITTPITAAQTAVGDAIEAIKGFFNFTFTWPDLPLPHFTITPSGWKVGDLLKGSIPHLSVDWYAKGGILTAPTIFGLSGGSLLGGGEAGPEAVLPISNLRSYISDALDEGPREIVYNQTINAYSPEALSPSEVARQTRNATRQMALQLRRA